MRLRDWVRRRRQPPPVSVQRAVARRDETVAIAERTRAQAHDLRFLLNPPPANLIEATVFPPRPDRPPRPPRPPRPACDDS